MNIRQNLTFAASSLAPPLGLLLAMLPQSGAWFASSKDLGLSFLYLEVGWLIFSLPLYCIPFVIGWRYSAFVCAAIAGVTGIFLGYSYPSGFGFAVFLFNITALGLLALFFAIVLRFINKLPSRSVRNSRKIQKEDV